MVRTFLFLLALNSLVTNHSQTYNVDFFSACRNGEILRVKEFLKKGIDLNQKDNDGNTAIMVSSRPYNLDIIKLLAESGAELNNVNTDGKTAMTLLYTRPWESNDYDREKNIWDSYLYLKSKGAKEQDYVDYIAKNISSKNKVEQEKVLQIKKTYNDFNNKGKTYKLKKFHEQDNSGNEFNYTHIKYDYQARYDISGNLLFFELKYSKEQDWEDNGYRESWTRQYFFSNGELYFYFEDNSIGNYPILEQYRLYIDKGEEVITAYKYFDNFYGAFPEQMKDITNFINIKCPEDKVPSVKNIKADFDKVYQEIKGKLK